MYNGFGAEGGLYAVASVVFFIAALSSIFIFKRHPVKISYILTLLVTAAWAGAQSYGVTEVAHYFEIARDFSWILFLIHLLNPSYRWSSLDPAIRLGVIVVTILVTFLIVYDVYQYHLNHLFSPVLWFYQYLILSIFALVLIEQLLRNVDASFAWAAKLLSISIASQFVYDMVLYSSSLINAELDLLYWNARPIFVMVLIPLMWISVIRIISNKSRVVVSRHVVFHSVSLISAGVYMLLMAAIGYYLQYFGGNWGGIAQIVFLGVAIAILVVLVFSGQVRATLRVFVNKHFFDYKYDYRQEWLRFMESFSGEKNHSGLEERIISSIAQIVDSTGGVLWVKSGEEYLQFARYNHSAMPDLTQSCAGGLLAFMFESRWVIDLRELKRDHQGDISIQIPSWLMNDKEARLLVPLFHQDHMMAVLMLNQPRADRSFNWEDHDLLKMVAQQSAVYLTLMNISQALHEAKQFEAFNRLSAYVVHDLKNVVAQLALVITNGKKYRDNPAFIDDAFDTVENAVKRMERMLGHLRRERSMVASHELQVDLCSVLKSVANARSANLPKPILQIAESECVVVLADAERLADVLIHLVQNAQEATPDDGEVVLALSREGDFALLTVSDTGCGMSAEFIHDKLFKPFVTTKGNAGMGIGVYEAKEYIQSVKGMLKVESTEGKGTCFTIRLPIKCVPEGREQDNLGVDL